MKFGVFSVSTPEYSVEETVKLLKEIGYDGVEWRVANPPPEEKPEGYTFERRYWTYNQSTLNVNEIHRIAMNVKNVCDKYGIEIYFLTTYLGPWDLEGIEKVMKAANLIGCRNIRVFPPYYDGKENYRSLFQRTVEQTKAVESLARQYKIRVSFEIHMGNIIPSASAAYRFASNFDPEYIGIIFDPGNMVHEGYENYKLGIDLLGEYLAHVHVKNAVWKQDSLSEYGAEVWKPVWAPLDKGYADLPKLFGILKEAGYTGYISVEDFTNEEDTCTKLKSCLAYLKNISK